MLREFRTLRELPFGALMEVYAEGNAENGLDFWPDLSPGEQLLRAEQDFYQYLQQVFFQATGAVYYGWEVNGKLCSALRLEPYRDGLLLEALETAPEHRRQGYAKKLVAAVLECTDGKKIYSHVSKRNTPSLKTHYACGFRCISQQAVYADGSVNDRCCTLLHE